MEFALAFPLFILLVLGVIAFSRLMMAYELGGEVGRRAARLAANCNMGSAQATAISTRLQPFIDASGLLQRTSATWLQLNYEPAGCDANTCRIVEARLTGLQPQIDVPGLATNWPFPAFVTRIPREAMNSAPSGVTNNDC